MLGDDCVGVRDRQGAIGWGVTALFLRSLVCICACACVHTICFCICVYTQFVCSFIGVRGLCVYRLRECVRGSCGVSVLTTTQSSPYLDVRRFSGPRRSFGRVCPCSSVAGVHAGQSVYRSIGCRLRALDPAAALKIHMAVEICRTLMHKLEHALDGVGSHHECGTFVPP